MGPNLWSAGWRNRQQLLSRLAACGWPVVYSKGPLDVWNRHDEQWVVAGLRGRFTAEEGGAIVERPGKWPARWERFEWWDRFAIRQHARRLISAAPRGRGRIAYIFHPKFAPFVEHLNPQFVVYHAYDALSRTPDWNETSARNEAMLVERADLVVVSSSLIAECLPGAGKARARELPNAADGEAFVEGTTGPCPGDLAAVPHPRIGYVGVISPKVDFRMIAAVSKKRPDWHWVLVGDVRMRRTERFENQPAVAARWQELQKRPNVHILGEKRYREVPSYIGHMDVNTMCYSANEGWWSHSYPLKTHEYLAAAKPVISARLPRIQELSSVIAFATTDAEWETAIEHALRTDGPGTPGERRAVAMENTWDHRVEQLEGWLLEVVGASE